jgi:hypothetical protein
MFLQLIYVILMCSVTTTITNWIGSTIQNIYKLDNVVCLICCKEVDDTTLDQTKLIYYSRNIIIVNKLHCIFLEMGIYFNNPASA